MFGKYLDNLKEKGGLIHNITNYVTVNDVANVLLASGASPVMADELEDAVEITVISKGLNINIGTLNSRTIKTMFAAGEKANELSHIVALDAVGVGASSLRTKTAIELIKKIKFDVIKGNISEIKTLITDSATTCGVDANKKDIISEENIDEKIKFIKKFAKELKTIIVVTGKIDIITDGEKTYLVRNGRAQMSKVTGTGCQLSALLTAFLVTNLENKLEAAVSAVITMGIAGEIGWENMEKTDGNSTYRNKIIDAIYNMDGRIIDSREKVERK